MAEVLSQNEVESLLSAIDPQGDSSGGSGGQKSFRSNGAGGQISVYDFKRPERVSKEQMRGFQALHEGFSREFGASLSAMLRSIVEVKLISVDQLTYSEFVFSLENPTCFNLMESEGLDGHFILDLNPAIIFPVVDRLLGGGKTTANNPMPTRPLTEIELKLVGRITKYAIQALENSWSNIAELHLKVIQVESNPQLVPIVPPNEVIVLISFEIILGDTRGIMNLCIPYNTIEPLAGKLSSDTWSSYSKKEIDPLLKKELELGLRSSTVELLVEVASTKITAGELSTLDVGDVIVTDHDKNDGISVFIEDRKVFIANPGLIKGHKAIEISRKHEGFKHMIPDIMRKKSMEEQETSPPSAESPASKEKPVAPPKEKTPTNPKK